MENPITTVQPEYAICVRGAYKHFGSKEKQHILNGLNMTVPRGSIYGLLGASGCGKSTLLSCIVGLRRLNAGDIRVVGGIPGSSKVQRSKIGYMPQELSLYLRFSIHEILRYFGWIAGMHSDLIEQRIECLVALLHLPDASISIAKLSGGQQRRTSLAVALLHDPELLILDEPTAGVDPNMRQDLWEHLKRIAILGNRTIFMTTHYIEEASYANVVGLMRGGRLLAEESPTSLMHTFGCETLVNVFLILSENQNKDICRPYTEIQWNCSPELRERTSHFQWSHMKALIWKNSLWMWRNLFLNLFVITMPLFQILLFCIAIGHDPTDLRLCVVNHELNALSTECNEPLLSCRYLDLLDTKCFKYELCQNENAANEELRRGRAWAVMVIGRDFSESILAGDNMNVTTLNEFKESNIDVRLELSKQPLRAIMRRDIQHAYNELTEELLTRMHKNPKLMRLPLTFETPVYGKSIQTTKYTSILAPGVLLTITFLMSTTIASSTIFNERHDGMMERSLVAGVTIAEIFSSHLVTQFIMMSIESMLLLFGAYVIFDLALTGSMLHVALLTLLTGFGGIGFGFLVAWACDNQPTVAFLTMGSFLPSIILSGIMWPVEGMHPVLRFVTRFVPLTAATESMRSITVRGLSILERDVYVGFVSMGIWSLVFLCSCIMVIKFRVV